VGNTKVVAIIAPIAGILIALGMIIYMPPLAEGECIMITMPGDGGSVERCIGEGKNLDSDQIKKLNEIIEHNIQLKLDQIEQKQELLSLYENQQDQIDELEKESQKVKQDPVKLEYLQPSDYDVFLRSFESEKMMLEKNQEYYEQESYSGDCKSRPAGTVCIKFSDGYLWLVEDSILGGWKVLEENGQQIGAAAGYKASYYHILNTNLVKIMK